MKKRIKLSSAPLLPVIIAVALCLGVNLNWNSSFSIGIPSALALVQTRLGLPDADYPTEGIPVVLTYGVDVVDVNVVTSINIDSDETDDGWTLTITSTNGTNKQLKLLNPENSTTIDYELEINNVSGTLGDGLTVSPAPNTTLIWAFEVTTIETSGTAESNTLNYRFDLTMTIDAGDFANRLAGTYVDTLSLVLAPNE